MGTWLQTGLGNVRQRGTGDRHTPHVKLSPGGSLTPHSLTTWQSSWDDLRLYLSCNKRNSGKVRAYFQISSSLLLFPITKMLENRLIRIFQQNERIGSKRDLKGKKSKAPTGKKMTGIEIHNLSIISSNLFYDALRLPQFTHEWAPP